MMRPVHIDELRAHLTLAQERLTLEKAEILKLHPLNLPYNREAYAFAYVRAERMGMEAINLRLAALAWLPMQLDTRSEMMESNRASMKRWLKSAAQSKPEAAFFGNDFMHSLTRCALRFGWNTPEVTKLTSRISNLFRDLSCLIGVAYYCNWLTEHKVESVHLSEPDNIGQTAVEFAALVQSPDFLQQLRAPEQNNGHKKSSKKGEEKIAKKEEVVSRKSGLRTSKKRPTLRVIEGGAPPSPYGSFTPDPLPAN